MEFDSKQYDPIIITIDGTAASGKGTLVKGMKQKLDDRYLTMDAGAMYRALTFYYLEKKISPDKLRSEGGLIEKLKKEVNINFSKKGELLLNDKKLTNNKIRGPHLDPYVACYAEIDEVKKYIVEIQKQIIENSDNGWILDGRCMGTAVVPNAHIKFFVDADPMVRASRRHRDYEDAGNYHKSIQKVYNEILERDKKDRETNIAPLLKPENAIEIDSMKYSKDEALIITWGRIIRTIIDNYKA